MRFLFLVYIDQALLDAVPRERYDVVMRDCIRHADELKAQGVIVDSQQLELPPGARTLRTRDATLRVTDGPFAETKEYLAGFNLVEARDLAHAQQLAEEFPWTQFGSIEIRAVRDMDAERLRVSA